MPYAQRNAGVGHGEGRWISRVAPRPRSGSGRDVGSRPHSCPQPSAGAPDASSDDPRQVLDLTEGGVSLAHLVLDLLDAVKDGRVISPAEDLADLHQREPGAFAHQIHPYVARLRERAAS